MFTQLAEMFFMVAGVACEKNGDALVADNIAVVRLSIPHIVDEHTPAKVRYRHDKNFETVFFKRVTWCNAVLVVR
ncbi:MAG TPA: hypothetical protein PKG67_15655 [Turneriella sp.]|nr:hypothetical protein [Turneriella sp.]